MYKHALAAIFLLIFLGGGYFVIIKAQNYDMLKGDMSLNYTTTSNGGISLHYDNTLDDTGSLTSSGDIPLVSSGYDSVSGATPHYLNNDISSTTEYVYRINTVKKHLALITKKVDILPIISHDTVHNAPDENIVYEIDQNTINNLLTESEDFTQFLHKLRINILEFMIDNGYKDFNDKPYQKNGDYAIIAHSGDFQVLKDIKEDDALDVFLKETLTGFQDNFSGLQKYGKYLDFNPIILSSGEYGQLKNLYLFKNEQDLRDLGYELVSRKTRINTDLDYRRHNISAAFSNIGNVRLILSDQIFSLAHEFHYSAGQGKIPYMDGYATVGGTPKKIYGGGLCGVATALFQGSMTNLGLSLVEYKAHTIYYRNLYEAEIDGTTISQPGLDATVYAGTFDFKIQNIRKYPILTVFNYDGKIGTTEQVFTLSKLQDKGSFAYVGESKKGSSKCFTWNIKGQDMTNCYTKVTDF